MPATSISHVPCERRVDGERVTELIPAREWLSRQDANMLRPDERKVFPPALPRYGSRDHLHDRGAVLCGIVSFTKAGVDPEAAKARLAEAGISVTVSAVRSTRIAMEAQGLEAVLRASVHYYNTAGEVERFAAAVDRL